MPNLSSLTIAQLNNNFLTTGTRSVAAVITGGSFTDAWSRVTLRACGFLADAGVITAVIADLGTLAREEATLITRDRIAGAWVISASRTLFRR